MGHRPGRPGATSARCGAPLKPKAGDCCVFCSYGSVPCPPLQAARGVKSGTGSP